MFDGIMGAGLLVNHTFITMLIVFIPVIFVLIKIGKEIKTLFHSIKKPVLHILLIIFLIGFWLRNFDYTYGVDVDGSFYYTMAKGMLNNLPFNQGCAIGYPDRCAYYFESVALPGYPFLISLGMSIFGQHDIIAMIINGVLGSLSIILIFLISNKLFKNETIAVISSAIFAFVPLDIYISSTAAVRTSSIFFTLLTILSLILAIEKRKFSLWACSALLFSFSIYMHLTNVIMIVPLAYLCLVYLIKKIDKKDFNIHNVFLLFILLIIFLIHFYPAYQWLTVRSFGMTGAGKDFSFDYTSVMIPKIFKLFFVPFEGGYLQSEYFFVPFISIFFFLGLALIFNKKYTKPLIFVILFFLVNLFLVSSFYQCPNFPNCTEHKRYMQTLVPSYALIAGLGLTKVVEFFVKNKKRIIIILPFVLLLVSLPFISFKSKVFHPEDPFKLQIFHDGRLDDPFYYINYETYSKIPNNSLILSPNTFIFETDFFPHEKNFSYLFYSYNSFKYYISYQEAFTQNFFSQDNIGKDIYFVAESNSCVGTEEMISNGAITLFNSNYFYHTYTILNKKIFLDMLINDLYNRCAGTIL